MSYYQGVEHWYTKPINRWQYWCRIIPLLILISVAGGVEMHWLAVCGVIGALVVTSQRLRDIGWNPWWALLKLIPIIGLAVSIPCGFFRTTTVWKGGC